MGREEQVGRERGDRVKEKEGKDGEKCRGGEMGRRRGRLGEKGGNRRRRERLRERGGKRERLKEEKEGESEG